MVAKFVIRFATNCTVDSPLPVGRRALKKIVTKSQWTRHKKLIHQLYIEQNKSLCEVARIVEQATGFRAGVRQYKYIVSFWGFKKRRPRIPATQRVQVRAQLTCRIIQGKEHHAYYLASGKELPANTMERSLRRFKTKDEATGDDIPTLSDLQIIVRSPPTMPANLDCSLLTDDIQNDNYDSGTDESDENTIESILCGICITENEESPQNSYGECISDLAPRSPRTIELEPPMPFNSTEHSNSREDISTAMDDEAADTNDTHFALDSKRKQEDDARKGRRLMILGKLALHGDDPALAQVYFSSSSPLLEKVLGYGNWDTLRAIYWKGILKVIHELDYGGAFELLHFVASKLPDCRDLSHVEFSLRVLYDKAECLGAIDTRRAIADAEKGMAITLGSLGRRHRLYRQYLWFLGVQFRLSKRYEDALSIIQDALDLESSTDSADLKDFSYRLMMERGIIHYFMGRAEAARGIFHGVRDLLQYRFRFKTLRYLETTVWLAAACDLQGDYVTTLSVCGCFLRGYMLYQKKDYLLKARGCYVYSLTEAADLRLGNTAGAVNAGLKSLLLEAELYGPQHTKTIAHAEGLERLFHLGLESNDLDIISWDRTLGPTRGGRLLWLPSLKSVSDIKSLEDAVGTTVEPRLELQLTLSFDSDEKTFTFPIDCRFRNLWGKVFICHFRKTMAQTIL